MRTRRPRQRHPRSTDREQSPPRSEPDPLRRAVDGRPGDRSFPRIARIACWRWCLLVTSNHLHVEVLRRPVDSAQYLSIRYSDRLEENDIVASVAFKGDSYDHALAESFHGLYKWELIYRHGPWRALDELEFATLGYIDWFNHRRLHGQITDDPRYTTPAAFEADHYGQSVTAPEAGPNSPSLYRTGGGSAFHRSGWLWSALIARVSQARGALASPGQDEKGLHAHCGTHALIRWLQGIKDERHEQDVTAVEQDDEDHDDDHQPLQSLGPAAHHLTFSGGGASKSTVTPKS